MNAIISLAALLSYVSADDIPSCGAGMDACPEKYPCCSASGTCGNGYVCLGGCDPRYSYSASSCVAMPIFPSIQQSFNGTEGVSTYADFLGDADKSPYSYLGNITTGDNNALRIQMYKGTTGSTVSSSHFVWYGKVTLKMRTSGGGGVVSDFILLSNVKDEIDYEFVGYDLNNAQSNYYWNGYEDYKNMKACPLTSDSENNYHEYTIDWQEDKIIWSIDGDVKRTLNKEDTKNATTGEYSFPQTPARVQFGLWPAGDSSAEGTREWAGGPINWSAGQASQDGYFHVDVESITVQPYDHPSGTNVTGSKSYIYTNKNGLAADIAITDDDYILKATDGTGDDLDGPYGHSSSSSAASSSAAPSSSAASSSASSSSAASSSATSSSASSSSAASSSVASSSAASSSAASSSSASPSSSKASSSRASSSSGPSSAASASSSSASNGKSSGKQDSSFVASGSTQTSSGTHSSSQASASRSAASTTSSSTSPSQANVAGQLTAPLLAAILPAALLL